MVRAAAMAAMRTAETAAVEAALAAAAVPTTEAAVRTSARGTTLAAVTGRAAGRTRAADVVHLLLMARIILFLVVVIRLFVAEVVIAMMAEDFVVMMSGAGMRMLAIAGSGSDDRAVLNGRGLPSNGSRRLSATGSEQGCGGSQSQVKLGFHQHRIPLNRFPITDSFANRGLPARIAVIPVIGVFPGRMRRIRTKWNVPLIVTVEPSCRICPNPIDSQVPMKAGPSEKSTEVESASALSSGSRVQGSVKC